MNKFFNSTLSIVILIVGVAKIEFVFADFVHSIELPKSIDSMSTEEKLFSLISTVDYWCQDTTNSSPMLDIACQWPNLQKTFAKNLANLKVKDNDNFYHVRNLRIISEDLFEIKDTPVAPEYYASFLNKNKLSLSIFYLILNANTNWTDKIQFYKYKKKESSNWSIATLNVEQITEIFITYLATINSLNQTEAQYKMANIKFQLGQLGITKLKYQNLKPVITNSECGNKMIPPYIRRILELIDSFGGERSTEELGSNPIAFILKADKVDWINRVLDADLQSTYLNWIRSEFKNVDFTLYYQNFLAHHYDTNKIQDNYCEFLEVLFDAILTVHPTYLGLQKIKTKTLQSCQIKQRSDKQGLAFNIWHMLGLEIVSQTPKSLGDLHIEAIQEPLQSEEINSLVYINTLLWLNAIHENLLKNRIELDALKEPVFNKWVNRSINYQYANICPDKE